MLVLLIIVLSAVTACPPCDPASCPQNPERDCPLGPSPDPCQCCRLGVCGIGEGQPCYNSSVFKDLPEKKRLGVCASNMLCLLRNDLGPDEQETACTCADQRVACGSDNKTYESTCKMYRVEKNSRVTLQHWGPCHHAPQVSSGPEGVTQMGGQPITLACEAKGFPVPSISWEFVASDGSVVVLPGDDPTVSVQTRGGPERLMVSSWVQITEGRKSDSGTYSCVASNDKGSTRALAHITIKSV